MNTQPLPRWFVVFSVFVLLVISTVPTASQTTNQFLTRNNHLVITNQAHWNDWIYSEGTISVSNAGEVQPRLWQRNTDATDDIVDFLRFQIEAAQRDPTTYKLPSHLQNRDPDSITLQDAVSAGSNLEDVVNILDGDMSTYWEPSLLASSDDSGIIPSLWWFTIDLGRVVFLKKLVLKFAPEEIGDPFLLFDVLASDGRRPIAAPSQNAPPEFFPLLVSIEPNKDRRVIEVDLRGVTGRRELGGEQDAFRSEQVDFGEESEESDDDIDKSMATSVGRFIQVVIQDSDLNRGREVSAEEYEHLSSADTGTVDFFKKLPGNREVRVTRKTYFDKLDDRDRGRIRYYRREKPRLAELEVWIEGDDIANGILRRGGNITSPDPRSSGLLLDSDVVSHHILDLYKPPSLNFEPQKAVTFDLGSFFWLDSQRMTYSFSSNDAQTFGDYTVEISDGSQEADGSLKWEVAVDREQTSQLGGFVGRITEGNDFDPVITRFLKLQWNIRAIEALGIVHLSEFQLFGSGFQPQVTLTSGRIPLGGSKNLISVEWDAETPPGTRVELQTRTGDTFTSDTLYYHGDNVRLYEGGADEYYARKNRRDKGNKVGIWIDGPEWEKSFSAPYKNSSGSFITSPSPREFVRLQATLFSDTPEAHATLNEVRLNFADPVARRLVGEITPARVETLGVQQSFSLYVRPDTLSRKGFDQLLLTGPTDLHLSYKGLYAGTAADFSEETTDLNDLIVAGISTVSNNPDTLHLNFPNINAESGIELLRLDFSTTLFTVSAPLTASLRLEDGGAWQRIDAGDATLVGLDNNLTLVGTPKRREIFGGVTVSPPILTPNNDGINDIAFFEFDILMVRESSAVSANIYDLNGRFVRRLAEQRETSTGSYALQWDGTNDAGKRVPPGLYIITLDVTTNTEGAGLNQKNPIRTIAVAY